jgi:hypothetical protein
VGEFDFLATGEFDIVPAQEAATTGEGDHSMSSHSIPTQSNSALHDSSCTSATVRLFDQAMVTVGVSAVAYIAAILIGWL